MPPPSIHIPLHQPSPSDPQPLTGDALLKFLVAAEHRDRYIKAGLKWLAPPAPACPACTTEPAGCAVRHGSGPLSQQIQVLFEPCGHTFFIHAWDLDPLIDVVDARVRDLMNRPAGEPVQDLPQPTPADEPPADGGTPWCCNGNAEQCALCTDPNPVYPFLCPGHPATEENVARVKDSAAKTTSSEPCHAYEPPTGNPEQSGLCAHCGNYDWRHTSKQQVTVYGIDVAEWDRLHTQLDRIESALRPVPKERLQAERPTHPDGTPFSYSEIVAANWGFCDGCRMWSNATQVNPHQCPMTHAKGPEANR